MEILRSNKQNGDKLIFNGYLCTKELIRLSGIRWQCVERTTHCRGVIRTANTVSPQNPVVIGEHNHTPSDGKVEIAKA